MKTMTHARTTTRMMTKMTRMETEKTFTTLMETLSVDQELIQKDTGPKRRYAFYLNYLFLNGRTNN